MRSERPVPVKILLVVEVAPERVAMEKVLASAIGK
jgi:hypothetical protein